MTAQEIDELAREALDAAARLIQDRLGVLTGDLAGSTSQDKPMTTPSEPSPGTSKPNSPKPDNWPFPRPKLIEISISLGGDHAPE